MTLNFLIAPDFAPERFAGWHMLNTLLQRRSGIQLHLLTPASPAEQAALYYAQGRRYDELASCGLGATPAAEPYQAGRHQTQAGGKAYAVDASASPRPSQPRHPPTVSRSRAGSIAKSG